MPGKSELKREDLKTRLIAAARSRIQAGGLKALRARDVTTDAGCALGSLYSVFGDLNDLVIHLNSDTLNRLGDALRASTANVADPQRKLECLVLAYLDFARTHYPLWLALFDTTMLADTTIPDWHREDQAQLIRLAALPLAELVPHFSQEELGTRARTLFSAMHGIVALSLENRFTGLSGTELETELVGFVGMVVRALQSDVDHPV